MKNQKALGFLVNQIRSLTRALEPHIAMSIIMDIAKSTKSNPPKPAPIYVFCGTFDGANESSILIFVYNIDPLWILLTTRKVTCTQKTENCRKKFHTAIKITQKRLEM